MFMCACAAPSITTFSTSCGASYLGFCISCKDIRSSDFSALRNLPCLDSDTGQCTYGQTKPSYWYSAHFCKVTWSSNSSTLVYMMINPSLEKKLTNPLYLGLICKKSLIATGNGVSKFLEWRILTSTLLHFVLRQLTNVICNPFCCDWITIGFFKNKFN